MKLEVLGAVLVKTEVTEPSFNCNLTPTSLHNPRAQAWPNLDKVSLTQFAPIAHHTKSLTNKRGTDKENMTFMKKNLREISLNNYIKSFYTTIEGVKSESRGTQSY